MKVLIADDDPISCRLLEAGLVKWGYEVSVARDGAQAWQTLGGPEAPRMAILDWNMPGLDGVQICRKVRERTAPYVYLILLTARDRLEDVVAGLEAGADEFLTKPFDPVELNARLRTGRRVLELQDSLLDENVALRFEAFHDGLTGALNRSTILDLLGRQLDRGSRERSPVGVILADLDHFKGVNDAHGHAAGDAVLRETVRRMSATLRPYDGIGRYGGEEFLIVLPGCDAAGAVSMAERMREGVAGGVVVTPKVKVPVTLSLGVTAVGGGASAPPEALIAAADAALYRAKNAGRNRVELATATDVAGTTSP